MEVYNLLKQFKNKYPFTVAWRIKAHSKIIVKHLNSDEKVLYAFTAQKNESNFELFHTFVIVITNQRIMLASKRLLFGYFFYSITPDMFNDLTVSSGILWGKVIIDTIKEEIVLTNLSKNSLPEVETNITKYMADLKKNYKDISE